MGGGWCVLRVCALRGDFPAPGRWRDGTEILGDCSPGTLQPSLQQQISSLIDLGTLPIEELVTSDAIPVHVKFDASVADVRAIAAQSGHLRILILGASDKLPLVVHLRDTLLEPDTRPAREIARQVFVLDAKTPVYESLVLMRKSSVQLAVVMQDGQLKGVVTLADILERILPLATAS